MFIGKPMVFGVAFFLIYLRKTPNGWWMRARDIVAYIDIHPVMCKRIHIIHIHTFKLSICRLQNSKTWYLSQRVLWSLLPSEIECITCLPSYLHQWTGHALCVSKGMRRAVLCRPPALAKSKLHACPQGACVSEWGTYNSWIINQGAPRDETTPTDTKLPLGFTRVESTSDSCRGLPNPTWT